MASVSNPYDLLKNRMEPEQLLQEAKSKKKKKNKNKANGAIQNAAPRSEPRARSAVEVSTEQAVRQTQQEARKSPNGRRPGSDEDNMALEEACPQLLRVATKEGRMSVWKDWISQVKAGDRSVLYRAADGSLVNFHKALLDSGAFETTVAHCMCVPLQRNEQPVLATLLSSCLPSLRHLSNDLADSIAELSRAMKDSRRDVQDAAVSAIKALMTSLKSSARNPPPNGGAPNVDALDKQLTSKRARLERALASTSDIPQEAAANAVDVAKLLAQKFSTLFLGGEAGGSQAGAEMSRLTGILGQYLESSQSSASGRKQLASAHLQEIRYLDSKIDALAIQIQALEAELERHKAELQQHTVRRANLQQMQSNASNGKGGADGPSAVEYQHQLHCVMALQASVAHAAGASAFQDAPERQAALDSTLQDLVRTCVQAAQIQDRFMESLLSQLQFARDRLQQAHRLRSLNDPYSGHASKSVTEADSMIDGIKRQSQATHDAALALDGIIVQQECAIKPSAKDSVLRSQAMQVKQIVNQVVMRHYQLMQEANAPLPYQQAQQQAVVPTGAAPQQWQMDDILRMQVGKPGAPQQPNAANSNHGPMRGAPPPAVAPPMAAMPMHMAPPLGSPAPAPVVQPSQPPMPVSYLPAGMPPGQGPRPVAPPSPAAPAPQQPARPPPETRVRDAAAQRSLDSAQQSLARLQASLGIPANAVASAGRGGGRQGSRGGRAPRA